MLKGNILHIVQGLLKNSKAWQLVGQISRPHYLFQGQQVHMGWPSLPKLLNLDSHSDFSQNLCLCVRKKLIEYLITKQYVFLFKN